MNTNRIILLVGYFCFWMNKNFGWFIVNAKKQERHIAYLINQKKKLSEMKKEVTI